MLKEFNLLATTYRRNERQARSELRYLLEQAGDPAAAVERTGVSGLIAAKTSLNAFDAIAALREILLQRPYEFRYLLRVIPIEKVVLTDLAQIEACVVELSSRIPENETFRITVEKRFTTIHSEEIIKASATNIKRKVNLTKPDRIILIEILGKFTGVSVAKPDQIISVLKEKAL